MVRCEQCGGENPDSGLFCKDCGASITATCPACGGRVTAGARFCGACGTPLEVEAGRPGQAEPRPADSGLALAPRGRAQARHGPLLRHRRLDRAHRAPGPRGHATASQPLLRARGRRGRALRGHGQQVPRRRLHGPGGGSGGPRGPRQARRAGRARHPGAAAGGRGRAGTLGAQGPDGAEHRQDPRREPRRRALARLHRGRGHGQRRRPPSAAGPAGDDRGQRGDGAAGRRVRAARAARLRRGQGADRAGDGLPGHRRRAAALPVRPGRSPGAHALRRALATPRHPEGPLRRGLRGAGAGRRRRGRARHRQDAARDRVPALVEPRARHPARGPLPLIREHHPVPADARHPPGQLRRRRGRGSGGDADEGARRAHRGGARPGRLRALPAPPAGGAGRHGNAGRPLARGRQDPHLRHPPADEPARRAPASPRLRDRGPPLGGPDLRGVPGEPRRQPRPRAHDAAGHVPPGVPAALDRPLVHDPALAAPARPRPLPGARAVTAPVPTRGRGRGRRAAGRGEPVLPRRAREGRPGGQRNRVHARPRYGRGRADGAHRPAARRCQERPPDRVRARPGVLHAAAETRLGRRGPRCTAGRAQAPRVPPRARGSRRAALRLQARPHPGGGLREPALGPAPGTFTRPPPARWSRSTEAASSRSTTGWPTTGTGPRRPSRRSSS